MGITNKISTINILNIGDLYFLWNLLTISCYYFPIGYNREGVYFLITCCLFIIYYDVFYVDYNIELISISSEQSEIDIKDSLTLILSYFYRILFFYFFKLLRDDRELVD